MSISLFLSASTSEQPSGAEDGKDQRLIVIHNFHSQRTVAEFNLFTLYLVILLSFQNTK